MLSLGAAAVFAAAATIRAAPALPLAVSSRV